MYIATLNKWRKNLATEVKLVILSFGQNRFANRGEEYNLFLYDDLCESSYMKYHGELCAWTHTLKSMHYWTRQMKKKSHNWSKIRNYVGVDA